MRCDNKARHNSLFFSLARAWQKFGECNACCVSTFNQRRGRSEIFDSFKPRQEVRVQFVDNLLIRKRGAGCQCWSPYFCLTFVHCPLFVLLLSYFCLTFVPSLSSVPLLSCLCLSTLSFVLIWTSFCHHWSQNCPTFVLIWPPESMGQILDKFRTKSFFYFLPGHPAPGQKADNIGTSVLNLSSICPGTLFML